MAARKKYSKEFKLDAISWFWKKIIVAGRLQIVWVFLLQC